MISSLLSFEGLSVEIVLAAVLADDYAAVVYVFGHSVLGGRMLDRADAVGGGVERDADEAGGRGRGHTEVAEAGTERAARVAEEAELALVGAALADAEGEDGGVVGSVYLERRAAERAGGRGGGSVGREAEGELTCAVDKERGLGRNDVASLEPLSVAGVERHAATVERGRIDLASRGNDELEG